MRTSEEVPRDEDLVSRAQAGDEAAFRTLWERHSPRLLAWLSRKVAGALQRKVGASDVLQEAYVVAFRRLADFEDRGDGSFRKWLSRIVELKLREEVRRHAGTAKRGIGREIPPGARVETAGFADRGPSPSQVAVAAELQGASRAAMAQLPEDYRQVLRLLQEQHLTLEEVAMVMNRSKEAVQKLYERSLARFADILGVAGKGRHAGSGSPG